jgi:DNA-binding CsgD family transcriptional regulator
MSPRFFTWFFVFASVGAFAVGTINIMRLRVEADTIGSRIQRIERDISLSKKELETLRRSRDQLINTLELQQRIGDALKPPVPEQVVWVRYFPAVASPTPMLSASPRMTAREIASLSWGGQGGPRSR